MPAELSDFCPPTTPAVISGDLARDSPNMQENIRLTFLLDEGFSFQDCWGAVVYQQANIVFVFGEALSTGLVYVRFHIGY